MRKFNLTSTREVVILFVQDAIKQGDIPMNDFTKEELLGLKNIVLQSRENYPAMHADKELSVVLNKISSMIDNYCEHKESVMDCDGGISLVCKECGYTMMDVM